MPVTIQSLNVKGTSVATASYVAWANVFETTADTFTGTASYATTASLANTASYVAWANIFETTADTFVGTASYATTASYAIFAENGGGGGGGLTATEVLGLFIAYPNRMI